MFIFGVVWFGFECTHYFVELSNTNRIVFNIKRNAFQQKKPSATMQKFIHTRTQTSTHGLMQKDRVVCVAASEPF